MASYNLLTAPDDSLKEAERLMNLSFMKIHTACQRDLPLRRTLLISSVLNKAQRAAADAIASLDNCSESFNTESTLFSNVGQENTLFSSVCRDSDNIEMHILGHDLLAEILSTEDSKDNECAQRKRPRESVITENIVSKPQPFIDDSHDSKRLKNEEEGCVEGLVEEDKMAGEEVPELRGERDEWSTHPYNATGMWMPNIWTTPVVC